MSTKSCLIRRNPLKTGPLALAATLLVLLLLALPAMAGNSSGRSSPDFLDFFLERFCFSTGDPDGKIATLSRPASPGKIETETADDFIVTNVTFITRATFTGLIPLGASLDDVTNVNVEIYHVFPADSAIPPSGNVPTRTNSPSDVAIVGDSRDSADNTLSFKVELLSPSFDASNSVVDGIFKSPNQFTGGEGPVVGQEVLISVRFHPALVLAPDHYFFRPEVGLSSAGDFLWLSAPKPIVPPGTPFLPDLQSWIRNENLAPDWLRIGTDITGQGPFNAAFTLSGLAIHLKDHNHDKRHD